MTSSRYPESPQRTCRYGHGALEVQNEHFGLRAIVLPGRPVGSGADSIPASRHAKPTEDLFVVQLWRCPRCGAIELVDRE